MSFMSLDIRMSTRVCLLEMKTALRREAKSSSVHLLNIRSAKKGAEAGR